MMQQPPAAMPPPATRPTPPASQPSYAAGEAVPADAPNKPVQIEKGCICWFPPPRPAHATSCIQAACASTIGKPTALSSRGATNPHRYRDSDGSAHRVEVLSVDRSIIPPSYVIGLNGRERETEGIRLTRISGPPVAPTAPATSESSGYAAGENGSGAPAQASVQGDWRAYCASDGAVYYHNVKTGETTWDRPPGYQGIGVCT